MIRFHYHTARTDAPRLGIRRGDRLCHAYSDRCLGELEAWGRSVGLPSRRIDRAHALPHFDLTVRELEERLGGRRPRGVAGRELAADIRAWRRRRNGQ